MASLKRSRPEAVAAAATQIIRYVDRRPINIQSLWASELCAWQKRIILYDTCVYTRRGLARAAYISGERSAGPPRALPVMKYQQSFGPSRPRLKLSPTTTRGRGTFLGRVIAEPSTIILPRLTCTAGSRYRRPPRVRISEIQLDE